MDARAQQRLYVLSHLLAGGLTVEEAARVLRLSSRQLTRLVHRYATGGAAALVHRNRGRPPANRVDQTVRARLLELATTTYAGFNPVHLAEELAEAASSEPQLSARTIRRILAEAGITPLRTRRPPRHRSRRERMPRAGMLLQADGSRHDWLEGRGPWLTLVGGIDDATNTVTGATFRLAEDAAGYFILLGQTAATYGLSLAFYSDRHGIFIKDPNRPATLTEQLTGKRSLTQVGRALEEAGIGWIGARSPQAKGRIERLWGTLQDRLVSELRRAGAATIEEANAVLARYLPRHNRRFAVPAADPQPAWRAWPEGLTAETVFCFHYRRRVAHDNTIPWDGAALALPRRRDGRTWAGREVVLEERLDGSLWAGHGGEHYPLREAPAAAPLLRARQLRREPLADLTEAPPAERPEPIPSAARPRRPAADHPWRRYPDGRRR